MAGEQLPDWLLGKHLTNVTITPLTVGAGGSLAYGASVSLKAVVESVAPELAKDVEDIGPVNSQQKNEVTLRGGFNMRLSALQKPDANAINTIGIAYEYAQVTFVQGAEMHSGYFHITGWSGGVSNRGANPATLTLGPCDVGWPNVKQYTIGSA